MAAIRKYLFDTSFDIGAETPEDVVEVHDEPVFSESDIAAARAEGYAAGQKDAAASTASTREQQAADALCAITTHLGAVAETLEDLRARQAGDAARLAAAMMRKLIPTLAASESEQAIEALVRDTLPRLMEEPRVVVRLAGDALDELAPKLDAAAGQTGFAGKLIYVGDPDMGPADCLIEWSDGGVERDMAALWREIDAAIEQFLTQCGCETGNGQDRAPSPSHDGASEQLNMEAQE